MLSKSFGGDPSPQFAGTRRAAAPSGPIDAIGCPDASLRMLLTAAKCPIGAAQRTAAAGLRPPPFPALIEGRPSSVNGLSGVEGAENRPSDARNLLTRLNFLKRPAMP